MAPERRALKLALRVAVIAAIAACLYFFLRKVEWSKLGDALASAKLWPIVVAAALNFVLLWGKAAAWHVMLRPRFDVPTASLFRYTIAAFAASVIAPARAGEVIRVWALKKHHGVPYPDSAATAIAEKLLDALSMLVVIAPVPWLVPGLPSWVATSLLICSGVAIAAFVVFSILLRVVKEDTTSWLGKFILGMHVLRSPKRLALAFAALTLTWIVDFAMISLVLYAVGIELPAAAPLLILFTLNLTIAVPSTPASVGALELGVLAATRLLGVAEEPALAFALIYHALQIFPLIIAGIALEFRLVLGRTATT